MFIKIDTEEGITASPKLTFGDALRLIGTATLALMNGVVDANNDDEKVKGEVYDMYNTLAGNILDAFDGDRSPATDLTAQAILEAENAILDRQQTDGTSN